MKKETTGFVEIISHYPTPACASCLMEITLTNYKGRFRQPPSGNMDRFQSFVSGKDLFQLVLRWEGLVLGSFGSFRLVFASFG